MGNPDLENMFLYHAPTDAAKWRHTAINSLLLETARKLVSLTPSSRDQSLMLTKLQEAKHWANSAVACNHSLLVEFKEQA